MKLAMFTRKEDYLTYLNNAIEYAKRGVRVTRERYVHALTDGGAEREFFLKTNNIPEEHHEQEWARHLEWLKGAVKDAERKVRKYERERDKIVISL